MLKQDQIEALKAPFPSEALSADTSRGFELTSIRAAYVIERLNEVFGPCGIGWRYVHSPFEEVETGNERIKIVTEVAFQYRFKPTTAGFRCNVPSRRGETAGWKPAVRGGPRARFLTLLRQAQDRLFGMTGGVFGMTGALRQAQGDGPRFLATLGMTVEGKQSGRSGKEESQAWCGCRVAAVGPGTLSV